MAFWSAFIYFHENKIEQKNKKTKETWPAEARDLCCCITNEFRVTGKLYGKNLLTLAVQAARLDTKW